MGRKWKFTKIIFEGTLKQWIHMLQNPAYYQVSEVQPNGRVLTGKNVTLCINDDDMDIPTSLTIPYGDESIYCYINGLQQFTTVVIPPTIKRIESGAFQLCKNLTVDMVSNPVPNLTYIGEKVFAAGGNVIMPTSHNLSYIGLQAFTNNKNIHGKVIVYAGVTYGDSNDSGYTYNGCTGVTEVEIEEGATILTGRMFQGCRIVQDELYIPSSVVTISQIGANRGGMQFNGSQIKRLIYNSPVTYIPGAFVSVVLYVDMSPFVTSVSAGSYPSFVFKDYATCACVLRGDQIPSGLSSIRNYMTTNTLFCKEENVTAFQSEMGTYFTNYIGFTIHDTLPSNPDEGKYYYNNSDHHIWKYENSSWTDITATYV